MRLKVARALSQVDPTSTAPVRVLADLLSGTDAERRRERRRGAGDHRRRRARRGAGARRALKDKDPAVRKSAVVALSKVGEPARPALANLVAALEDRKLHEPLLTAIKNIGSDKAVPPLIQALKDKEPSVRLGAAQALGQFGDDAADAAAPLDRAIAVEKDDEVKKAMHAALMRIKPG